eukprot:jgi/Galph1/5140/GphlegSOOS_G3729.1
MNWDRFISQKQTINSEGNTQQTIKQADEQEVVTENEENRDLSESVFDKELASLIEEREAILKGTSEEYLKELSVLENERRRKLERATESYRLQLEYVEQLYEYAKKEAYDSLQSAKSEQREYMWRVKLEREITLRLLRLSIPLKDPYGQVVIGNVGLEGFMNLIYRHRPYDKPSYYKRSKLSFIREELTADQTNYDLEMIIRGLEELQQISSSSNSTLKNVER